MATPANPMALAGQARRIYSDHLLKAMPALSKAIDSGSRPLLVEPAPSEVMMRRRQDGNFFVFTVTEEFDIDGAVDWNPARFINHSCAPNCEAQEEDEQIWIIALRDIRAGEELSFNYGYDLQDYEEHPCRCGAPQCLGYMVAEEHFDDVKRLEKKRKKEEKKQKKLDRAAAESPAPEPGATPPEST